MSAGDDDPGSWADSCSCAWAWLLVSLISFVVFLTMDNDQDRHLLVLFGLFASLTLSCIIASQKQIYWYDELVSYYFVADPLFQHMLSAFADKINNTPIVYFVLGWLWTRVFGASEVSLRLFSSFGFSLAAVVTWQLLRRNYSSWASIFATVGVFALSILILHQNAEARMYGLFLALAAVALLLFDQILASRKCSTSKAAAVSLVHMLLLHTHLFGIFYSATIIGVGFIADLCRRDCTPRLYVAYFFAWLSLFAYLPAFIVQADAGSPRSWIPAPTIGDLAWFYGAELRFSGPILLLLCIVLAYRRLRSRPVPIQLQLEAMPLQWVFANRATLVLACCFVALPACIWILSVAIKPIFFKRYMLPTFLGIAVLIAHVIDSLDKLSPKRSGGLCPETNVRRLYSRAYHSAAMRQFILAVLLLAPVAYSLRVPPRVLAEIEFENDFDYGDLPIVVQSSDFVATRQHYEPSDERFVYILDWESAVAPESGLFPPQEFKHMDALLRNYPERFAHRIIPFEDFLTEHDRFLVIDDADFDRVCDKVRPWYKFSGNLGRWQETLMCPRFLENRVLPDPGYDVTLLGAIVADVRPFENPVVLLVERVPH